MSFLNNMARRNVPLLAIAAVSLVAVLWPGHARPSTAPEYDVKAAFIYNFAKFVEWPDDTFRDPESPITLCVYGRSPVEKAFDAVRGKKVRGRELVVKFNDNIDNLRACNIIYISYPDRRHAAQVLDEVRGASILTVGEQPEFIQNGGMINFTSADSKIRFEINPQAARRVRLVVSSQLLKLADITKGTKER